MSARTSSSPGSAPRRARRSSSGPRCVNWRHLDAAALQRVREFTDALCGGEIRELPENAGMDRLTRATVARWLARCEDNLSGSSLAGGATSTTPWPTSTFRGRGLRARRIESEIHQSITDALAAEVDDEDEEEQEDNESEEGNDAPEPQAADSDQDNEDDVNFEQNAPAELSQAEALAST